MLVTKSFATKFLATKITKILFFNYFFRIAKEANLADKDVHPLTASCSGENSNRDGMETWNVHCDSNQNGKIDPGQIQRI